MWVSCNTEAGAIQSIEDDEWLNEWCAQWNWCNSECSHYCCPYRVKGGLSWIAFWWMNPFANFGGKCNFYVPLLLLLLLLGLVDDDSWVVVGGQGQTNVTRELYYRTPPPSSSFTSINSCSSVEVGGWFCVWVEGGWIGRNNNKNTSRSWIELITLTRSHSQLLYYKY